MTSTAMAMEHQLLRTVDDDFALERACAICGELALAVIHVKDLPDYVNCSKCGSAFILSEGADWAMFGSISADYPETRQMILKRWTTLEAVEAMARSERSPGPPEEEVKGRPTPPFGIGGNGTDDNAAAQASTPPFGLGELDEFEAENSNGSGVATASTAKPLEETADSSEPEPGKRYVVTLAQKTVSFPAERCAHCLRRPAPKVLLVAPGSRAGISYRVPLCQSCHDRASARSEDQRTSKIVAHLTSVLAAGVLIVGSIVIGLVNVRDPGAVDLLLLVTLAFAGYGLPAILLLGRSSRVPPSEDANFVRSTLRIRETEGLEFGWRNRGYAELFSNANEELLLGEMARESENQ